MTPPTGTAPLGAPQPGSFGEFVADLRRAVAICRMVPWLPAFELALLLLMAGANRLSFLRPDDVAAGIAVFLASVLYLAVIGWLGAQRLVYRGAMTGDPVDLGQLGPAIASQGWRYLKLGGLLLPVFAVFLAITVVSIDDLLAETPQMSTTGRALSALVAAGVGVALTLVTPALSFETDSAREAWALGTGRLRRHWRLVRWHALLVPAFFAAGPTVALGFDGPVAQSVALLTGLVTFVARGAIVALHLRLRERELADLPPPRPVIL